MRISEQWVLPGGVIGELCNFTEDDISEILAVEQRANPSPWSEKNFRDSVAGSHICVGVKVDSQWIAHAVFSRAAGEAELLIVAVDPAWQNKGVAKKLLGSLATRLSSGADSLFLEVRESNAVAINLYESLGFNCVGTRPGYYPALSKGGNKRGREDAFIYALSLNIAE